MYVGLEFAYNLTYGTILALLPDFSSLVSVFEMLLVHMKDLPCSAETTRRLTIARVGEDFK